jgi:hypothetical protein
MSQSQPITIRVMDADGSPVEEASVVVASSSVPFPEIALLADSTGNVRMFLPAGRFGIEAHGPKGGQGTIDIEVSASETHPKEFELRLRPRN